VAATYDLAPHPLFDFVSIFVRSDPDEVAPPLRTTSEVFGGSCIARRSFRPDQTPATLCWFAGFLAFEHSIFQVVNNC
jgi:hypothetical protein